MKVTIRYFASMRDRMGKAEELVQLDVDAISVAELWSGSLSRQPLSTNTLVAINMEYASADDMVHDGDELAFFPPVTGG